MGCRPLASSVHGISWARILEWAAVSFSRDPPRPGIESTPLASLVLVSEFFTTEPNDTPQIYLCPNLQMWCWRRLLRVPCTVRRSNQSIKKEISPEYSLEGLMLKLKLQYFGHLMPRRDSLEKTLMLGRFEGRRRRGQQKMRWLDGIIN